jgi:16S rRNA U1498 N3-methylase RsmE
MCDVASQVLAEKYGTIVRSAVEIGTPKSALANLQRSEHQYVNSRKKHEVILSQNKKFGKAPGST